MGDKRGWQNDFVKQSGQALIELWLERLEKRLAQRYSRSDLRQNGEMYLPLLMDIDVPLEEHPGFDLVPSMCQYHAVRDTPLADVLASSHIWREALLETVSSYIRDKGILIDEAFKVLSAIHLRIDRLQEFICHIYWDNATTRIHTQEERIGQLHQDRLSLIGKMAASMAHELRNPLFAIKGLLQLVRKEGPVGESSSADALASIPAPRIIRIESSEDAVHVYLALRDNGPGIPPELGDSIFTPFVTSKQNGTGLGLPICKQIMVKNGGNIRFASEPNSTVFTLTLPKE